MLHAPVSENKTQDKQSKTQSESESERRALGWAGSPSLGLGGENGSSAGNQRAQGWQPINLSALSQGGILQRKCAYGSSAGSAGTCEECQGKEGEMLQTKLKIGEPGDKYEQEADQVADEVMRMPESTIQPSIGSETKKIVRRKEIDRPKASEVPPIVHEVLSMSGQPLERDTQTFMEDRFGYDFSQVRVHTDKKAATSAAALEARAYTVQNNVVFGAGQYNPQTIAGRHLVSHELAHVVQQKNATYPVQGITFSAPVWEQEAETAANAVLTDQPVQIGNQAPQVQLARQSIHQDSRTVQETGQTVKIDRVITRGRCFQVPETRTNRQGEIKLTDANFEVSYCRGNTRATAEGELDYSDIFNKTINLVPDILSNPRAVAQTFEQAIQQAAPQAGLKFRLEIGKVSTTLQGQGKGSIEGGLEGQASLGLDVPIGDRDVSLTVTIRGGTQEPTSFGLNVSGSLGSTQRQIPNCFTCLCSKPQTRFQCTQHPQSVSPPPKPALPIVYIPLFFEYADVIPRAGWGRYQEMLQLAIQRIREGYTISQIDARTSPEGSLPPGRQFEGNISLAHRRSEKAQRDLNAALDLAISTASGTSLLQMRSPDSPILQRLQSARSGSYPVNGTAQGGAASSAELFGNMGTGEVSEGNMLKHLTTVLQSPPQGQPDPLVDEHVIGDGLPSDFLAEIEAEVTAFRTGIRDGQKLSKRDRLETIFRPFRRALITLQPPTPPPIKIPSPLELADATVGQPISCSDAQIADFKKNVPTPPDQLEGKCRPERRGGESQ